MLRQSHLGWTVSDDKGAYFGPTHDRKAAIAAHLAGRPKAKAKAKSKAKSKASDNDGPDLSDEPGE